MRGLAACLIAGALFAAGCGSNDSSSKAPGSQQAPAESGTATSVAVSAKAAATAASLCQPEGVAKLKKQCAKGLKKISNGSARNPAAACQGLSKKKTKGVKGKSPYAVCVAGAAKLMATKHPKGNGKSKHKGAGDSADDSETADDENGDLICTDSEGKNVQPDDPDVDDCEPAAGASSSDDSADDSEDDGSSDDEDD